MRTDVQDILFHFALEEHLMTSAQVKGPLLYVWRPASVVTIGRHQNPWKECVMEKLDEDGVAIARRKSGGGAIFQDPGGTVFTFLAPTDLFSIDRNFEVVQGALRRFGIEADRKGRNDMTVGEKKMSGSAFKYDPSRGMSLHHGTLLVEADMKRLSRYLTPDKRKLQAKGITSVAARVMNLRDEFPEVSHAALEEALFAEFRKVYGVPDLAPEVMAEDSPVASEPGFVQIRAEFADKEWRLGRTPEFSHQLDTRVDGIGIFDVHLQVIGGKVSEAKIFSDVLFPDVIDQAMTALAGAEYGRQGLKQALDSLQPTFPDGGASQVLSTLTEWLVANVDD